MGVRTALHEEARALWSDGRGVPLVAVAVGWGLLIGVRMILPVILPFLREQYGLTLATAGLLVTVLWLFGALGQFPSGLLADAYRERTLLVAGLAVVAVALAIVVTATSAVALFVATALWGLGMSLYPIARITLLSSIFPDRVGSALGVTMATGDVGQTVLPPIAAVLAATLTWQAGLGFVIPLLGLAAVGVVVGVGPDAGSVRSGPGPAGQLRDTLSAIRRPGLGFVTGILFLYLFIWQSFTAFYPTYLIGSKGVTPTVASVLFGLYFLVGVVVKPLAGAAYDRVGLRGALIAVLGPPVVGFVALPLVGSIAALLATTVCISVMLGAGTITQSFLADSFRAEVKGTGLGVVRTTTATLGAAGPVVFGVVGEYGYFDQGYVGLGVVMAVVIALTLRMPVSADTR